MLTIPGYQIGERIHQSQRRSIHRAVRVADGHAVVIKTLDVEYPGRQEVAELRREFHLLSRLQAIESVVRVHALEPWGNGNLALVLEPFGHSLAEEIEVLSERGLRLESLFRIAISLADALARVHALDVVHKNIEPHSILVDDADAIRLIDFSIASELSLERQNDALSRRLEGALRYMSPEQTGRMNRLLDYRSDFYSLGITLFELLTGELPFHAHTVLEWVHSHIGKAPPSPSDLDPRIPSPVSAIVLKLMAKNAEDRYQSSYGLIEDLGRCQRELAQTGSITPFALGHRDVSRKFNIPQRLYGREPEQAALLALFERVAAGGTEFCMISGHSGVGKSALVNEIAKPLVRRQGFLIQGKFDQFQRSTPYSAVSLAFRSLARQLMVESGERREALHRKLNAAVAPNGQLLVDLIPELVQIIGTQPPVAELPPNEAQNRLQMAFLNFVRAVASEQPLVIFLDDLQFSDASTLNLMRWLATARDLPHLLFIGAYRSNEVDVGHPLRLALNEIQQSRAIHELGLLPLAQSAVENLVADALHTDAATCRPLAELLHERAQGNPFFLTEMLRTLEQARAIAFAPDAGRWRWDMDAVRRSGLDGDVVDFVLANLRKLPDATQRALQLAACIGDSFDLRTLSIIHERPMDEAGEDLLPALQRHLVVPLNEDYKLVGKASGAEGLNPTYRFQHDRVQQAAYALIDADHKEAVHLSIGRLIQRHASEEEREQRLIEIVGHLNECRRLIVDPDERQSLARMNLAAGIRAQRSSSYESALGYLRIGLDLLPADGWTSDPDLAMTLATEYQQCAYLTARFDEAESWIEQMLAHARTNVEKAEILSMRTRQYATTGKMEASIQAATTGLALLGMRLGDNPDRAAIGREIATVRRNLAGRKIAELIGAPPMTDRAHQVAIRLLMEIFPAAFLSGSGNLFPFLVLKAVNISLRHGNSPESAFAYAAYGMLLCGVLDDPALGYEYGKLAVAMNERSDDIALKSRVIYLYAMFIHHWSNHWSTMTPWFRRGIEAGYESGDLLYLAYSAQDCIIWDPRLDLETAAQEHADFLTIVRDCEYQDSLDSGTLFLQMQRNFLGLTDGLCSMNDTTFDEQRCLEGMQQRRFMTGVANYHIYKAEIFHFYGQHAQALVHVREQDKLIASAMSLPQLARFYIVAFLTLAACLPGMTADEQAATRMRMRADLRRMTRWAVNCPANFLHLQRLMQAELARLDGRVEPALFEYEQAMDAARNAGFRRDEAMANELAARHLLAAGRRKQAEGYLRAARNLYEAWGARRKVTHLEEEFSSLLRTTAKGVDSASLDLASVLKASQAISSEITLEHLWTTTMRIMLENAGGQRGCFVVRDEGQLMIEGLCETGPEPVLPVRAIPFDTNEGALALPISIVYHVLHTNSPIVLQDAARAGRFARDAYLLARQPQSVLCIPLQRNRKFEGAIYMENSLTAGVFTDDRIELIKLLAAQVSISIENARLYKDQQRLIDAQRRFVPSQFLESLDRRDIARVDLGENVAKTMTVMFADLRGFTPLAERLDPRSIIDLLNRYFRSMEEQITQAGGFIDSFAGDEIKVLFDTPPDAAVRAGIDMWRALEAFNVKAAALGQPMLAAGIGANTGPVVLGTVGGVDRIQCTVIGDTVNLASRIEQLTKVYGGRFLIGEPMFRSLQQPDAFALRRVDRVAVKGKNVAVDLYEVIDAEPADRRAAKLATRAQLDSAMALYFQREFDAAMALFEAMSEADPDDAVPRLFAERCARFLNEPVAVDWQGFERLMHK
ncbi:AAA family ATPase [Variovorax sp. GT1P44]|uniref:AAA family ATPase n=1 Tax=Variovorax sp. GT1P44 TaxID=3443742 RepID=UPI003F46FFE2